MGHRGSDLSLDEKFAGPAGTGFAGGFLRRQREEDSVGHSHARSNSGGLGNRRKRWDAGRGPGGPISQSAIGPMARRDPEKAEAMPVDEDHDALGDSMAISTSDSSSNGKEKKRLRDERVEEIYQEGGKTIIEDEEGNVLAVRDSHGEHGEQRRQHDEARAMELLVEKDVQHGVAQKEHGSSAEAAPGKIEAAIEHPHKTWRKRIQGFSGHQNEGDEKQSAKSKHPEHKRGPALAYQFGNTIIVEDEDGEVIKKYDIPPVTKTGKDGRTGPQRGSSMKESSSRAIQSLKRMGTYMGVPAHAEAGPSGTGASDSKKKKPEEDDDEDDGLRFTVTAEGCRMSKLEFIQKMSQMNPKDRAKFVQSSNAPDAIKTAAHQDARKHVDAQRRAAASKANVPAIVGEDGEAEIQKIESPAAEREGRSRGPEGLTLVDSNNEDIPFHAVRQHLADHYSLDSSGETAAVRRRRLASQQSSSTQVASRKESAAETSSDDETPAERRRRLAALQGSSSPPPSISRQPRRAMSPAQAQADEALEGETAAERRRRLGALGVGGQETPESDSEEEETGDPLQTGRGTQDAKGALSTPRTPGIRFADQPRVPTKDERAAEDARDKEGKEGKTGLGKLIRRR